MSNLKPLEKEMAKLNDAEEQQHKNKGH